MDYITTNNGVKMPQLGYGVYQTPTEETESCVLTAIKNGYRSIDTAQAYGNEEGVGQWFFRFPAEPDLYRQVYHCFHDLGKYPCTGNRSSSCTEDSGCECNEEYVLHSVYHEYDNRRFHLEIHFFTGICSTF